MQIKSRLTRFSIRLGAVAAIAAATASCGIEKQSAPGLAGPSEFALSLSITASPDTLQRDGGSQSTIMITARNAENNPEVGRAITIGLNPSNGGQLSASQVTTGSDGRASVIFTAPSLNTPVTTTYVVATPVGSNFENSAQRAISIALLAPASAFPSFTFTPTAPAAFQLTTFDASATTLDGVPCGNACQYDWSFGGEASGSGQVTSYRFQQEAVYVVTLSVTSPGGVTTSTQRTVTVGTAIAPVAAFTFSPANPRTGDVVLFNASSSTASNGATIVSYEWDFGGGTPATGTGVTASSRYILDRAFTVRLTVRDSRGQTHSIVQVVTVTLPPI